MEPDPHIRLHEPILELSAFFVPHVLQKSNFGPSTLFWSKPALKLLIKSNFGS
jgi:hypothetical protein